MTDKLREAAQQALEALEEPQDPVAYNGWVLREVLFDKGVPVAHREPPKAEPQEPVAWMSPGKERLEFSRKDTVYGSHTIPLYTAPQPAKQPLTDEWIRERCPQTWVFETVKRWVREVEAAHGINVPQARGGQE